jgi:hypothetical protein
MKKYPFLFYLFFLRTIIPLYAQSSTKGIVKDAARELLPGANVVIKNTSKGIIIIESIQNFRMKINNRDYPKQQKQLLGFVWMVDLIQITNKQLIFNI